MLTSEVSDRAWLAGIVDGEGCIYLVLPGDKSWSYCSISIANTDVGILEEVKQILEDWSIFYTIQIRPESSTNKIVQVIYIRRQSGCRLLLEQILPYLKAEAKIERGKQMLDYLENHRLYARKEV